MNDQKQNKYQSFMATFFKDHTKYEEVEVNGFIITQQIHGVDGYPVYCLYTKESFKNYKDYQIKL